MFFKKKDEKKLQEQPQPVQINLIDVVKQASMQMRYEEIGSWLATHKTPLFWCHDKGFSIIDKNFIEQRQWLKRSLNRMVKEIEELKAQKQKEPQASEPDAKPEKMGYIG